MKKLTVLEIVQMVLKQEKIPLKATEIYDIAEKQGLVAKINLGGKTPHYSFSSRLYVNVKKEDSIFAWTGNPKRFYLKSQTNSIDLEAQKDPNEDLLGEQKSYTEKDLHPILASFVSASPRFDCYTKTISHEKSQTSTKGVDKWVHPDMVGVYFPYGQYEDNALKVVGKIGQIPYKIYSFELKKSINLGTIREYYFQALSNSSWANEGYLAGVLDTENDELLEIIRKLNSSFGIGVIALDPNDFTQSEVIANARFKANLDLVHISDLGKKNPDFKEFLEKINQFIDNENTSTPHKNIIKNGIVNFFDKTIELND